MCKQRCKIVAILQFDLWLILNTKLLLKLGRIIKKTKIVGNAEFPSPCKNKLKMQEIMHNDILWIFDEYSFVMNKIRTLRGPLKRKNYEDENGPSPLQMQDAA